MLEPVTEDEFTSLMEATQRRFTDSITQRKIGLDVEYIFAGMVIIARYTVGFIHVDSDETFCYDHQYDFESVEKVKCAT